MQQVAFGVPGVGHAVHLYQPVGGVIAVTVARQVCLLGQAVADSVITVVEEYAIPVIRRDQPVERVIDVVDCLA